MAQQIINHGSVAKDGTGELHFSAFDKVNDNFTELYAGTPEAHSVNYADANAAINAALSASGYAQLKPDQVYLLSDDIELTSSKAISGKSLPHATLQAPDAFTAVVRLLAGSHQSLHKVKLTQNVDTANSSSSLPAVFGNGYVTDVHITYCDISRVDRQAIGLLQGGDRIYVLNNNIFQAGRAGIVLSDAKDSIVSGNQIDYTGDDAIAFNDTSRRCIAAHNIIRYPGAIAESPNNPTGNTGQGFAFKVHGQQITLSDNTVEYAFSGFIEIKPSNSSDGTDAFKPDNIRLTDNKFYRLIPDDGPHGITTAQGSGTPTQIGSIYLRDNTWDCERTDGTHGRWFDPTHHLELFEADGENVTGCFWVVNLQQNRPEQLILRNSDFTFNDWRALPFSQDMDEILIENCTFRTGEDPDARLLFSTGTCTIGRVTLRGVKLEGDWKADRCLIDLGGSSTTISELILEDCTLNGVPTSEIRSGSGSFTTIRKRRPAPTVVDLSQSITDPPTQAEVQAIQAKVNEILDAQRTAGVIEG